MNNDIFFRLENLMKKTGLSVNSGSLTKAEMKASAAGISLVHNQMAGIMKNIFIDTAEKEGTAMFLSMVNEKPADSVSLSKELVTDAVSDNPCIYSKSRFDSVVKADGTSSYSMSGNIMDFRYGGTEDRLQFETFSKLIHDINPCTVIVDNHIGRTFAVWDKAAFRWFELDSFSVPFITLDGMK